jgi:hypothetical protein
MYDACVKPVQNGKNKKKCDCGRELEVWGKHCLKKKKEVRCALFDRDLHSRVPLSFTPLLFRLKLLRAWDQWHFLSGVHSSYRLAL